MSVGGGGGGGGGGGDLSARTLQGVDAYAAAHLAELGAELGVLRDLVLMLGGELLQVLLERVELVFHLPAAAALRQECTGVVWGGLAHAPVRRVGP